MSQRKLLIIASILLAALCSCDGGLNCPLDPPECCYNVLTGCQLFDLPQGCSCSRYGLYTRRIQKAAPSLQSLEEWLRKPGLTGSWSGTLRRTYSSCPISLASISSTISIREVNKRVYVTIPGYGVLRGRKNAKGFTAQGVYTPPSAKCTANASVTFKTKRAGLGDISASLSTGCLAARSCTLRYRGVLQKRV